MPTLTENLQSLVTSKENLRLAINDKGGELPEEARLAEFAQAVENLPSGGGETGGDVDNLHRVRFFDYDGTLLKTEYVATGESATAPTVPTHQYLTFKEWNNNFGVINRDVDTGANYMPTGFSAWETACTGQTPSYVEFDAVMNSQTRYMQEDWHWNEETETDDYIVNYYNRLTVNVFRGRIPEGQGTNLCVIDWGDGSTPQEITGGNGYYYDGNLLSNEYSHDYAEYGTYHVVIKCNSRMDFRPGYCGGYDNICNIYSAGFRRVCGGAFAGDRRKTVMFGSLLEFGGADGKQCIPFLVIPRSTTLENSFEQNDQVKRVILPDTLTTIPNNCFYYSTIEDIYIPDSVKTIGQLAFSSCHSLTEIYIPDTVETFTGGWFLRACTRLKKMRLPQNTVYPSDFNLYGCDSLEELVLPEGMNTNSDVCGNCWCLKKVVIPASATKIGSNLLNQCYSLKEIYLKCTTPPELPDWLCYTIDHTVLATWYVPYSADHSVLNAYLNAPGGWAKITDKIKEMPEGELESL